MKANLILLAALAASSLPAQHSLPSAVKAAGENYGALQAAREQALAAAAGVQLARTAYLPKGDIYGQVNRATINNIFGMMMPNSVIAPISGPPLATNAGTNVWGSATGILISWEPFDLGQRAAHLAAAQATRAREESASLRVKFETEVAVADAFLSALAAAQIVKSAEASVERARAVETVVDALVASGLRPAADSARARAERASAQAQLVQAHQALAGARAALVRFLGDELRTSPLSPGPFLTRPPAAPAAPTALSHPAAAEQEAALAESVARRVELEKAWRPKFQFQSALYARGTGALPDGTTLSGANGLGPNIYNWGAGFSVLFPFLDLPAIRARRDAESHRSSAEQAKLRRLRNDLQAESLRADAQHKASREITGIIPVQLDSARTAFSQAQARYKAGLAPITDLADAQRLLAQADIDSSLAHLAVWRAYLAVNAASGDIGPFLAEAER
jgi:outer membrane protein TolC